MLGQQGGPSDTSQQTSMEHAKAFSESTCEALTSSFDLIASDSVLSTPSSSPSLSPISSLTAIAASVELALKHAVDVELSKYKAQGEAAAAAAAAMLSPSSPSSSSSSSSSSAPAPFVDPRLDHILVYLGANQLARDIKLLAVYDIFRMNVFNDASLKMKLLQTLAQIKYNDCVLASLASSSTSSPQPPTDATTTTTSTTLKTFERWQTDFRDYRSIVAAFINAVNFLDAQRYEEAAQFFCVACEYNERITANLTNRARGMDHDLLLASRRKCLKLWNQSTIRKFTSRVVATATSPSATGTPSVLQQQQQQQQQEPVTQQELSALIETMISKFLPCFFRLATSSADDRAMIEEIRKDWLNILDSNLPGKLKSIVRLRMN